VTLPILGVDGTLAKAPADLKVKGKVQAKTGTLIWRDSLNRRYLLAAKGLAGYLTTESGRELAFAFFVNRVHVDRHTDGEQVGHDLMRLCDILYTDVK
jgi:D-alanyl-D-alanine carboxypeptidase/D-alanyl-D-alanine-endopeptidase (penicillin-binding protein 4)